MGYKDDLDEIDRLLSGAPSDDSSIGGDVSGGVSGSAEAEIPQTEGGTVDEGFWKNRVRDITRLGRGMFDFTTGPMRAGGKSVTGIDPVGSAMDWATKKGYDFLGMQDPSASTEAEQTVHDVLLDPIQGSLSLPTDMVKGAVMGAGKYMGENEGSLGPLGLPVGAVLGAADVVRQHFATGGKEHFTKQIHGATSSHETYSQGLQDAGLSKRVADALAYVPDIAADFLLFPGGGKKIAEMGEAARAARIAKAEALVNEPRIARRIEAERIRIEGRRAAAEQDAAGRRMVDAKRGRVQDAALDSMLQDVAHDQGVDAETAAEHEAMRQAAETHREHMRDLEMERGRKGVERLTEEEPAYNAVSRIAKEQADKILADGDRAYQELHAEAEHGALGEVSIQKMRDLIKARKQAIMASANTAYDGQRAEELNRLLDGVADQYSRTVESAAEISARDPAKRAAASEALRKGTKDTLSLVRRLVNETVRKIKNGSREGFPIAEEQTAREGAPDLMRPRDANRVSVPAEVSEHPPVPQETFPAPAEASGVQEGTLPPARPVAAPEAAPTPKPVDVMNPSGGARLTTAEKRAVMIRSTDFRGEDKAIADAGKKFYAKQPDEVIERVFSEDRNQPSIKKALEPTPATPQQEGVDFLRATPENPSPSFPTRETPTTEGPVKGVAQMRREAEAKMGRRVEYDPTLKAKGIRGAYDRKPEVVRTAARNDLGAISHEIGHHLDKTLDLGGANNPHGAFIDSLVPHSWVKDSGMTDPAHIAAFQRREGLAEAIRMMIEEPQKILASPEGKAFVDDLTKRLDIKDPKMADMLYDLQADYQKFKHGDAKARIIADIALNPNEKPRGLGDPLGTALDDHIQGVIDRAHYLEKTVKEQKARGVNVSPSDDPALAARKAASVGNVQTLFLEHGVVDKASGNLVPGTKGLKQIVRDSGDVQDLIAYGVSKTEAERYAKKGIPPGPGHTIENVKNFIAKVEGDPKKYANTLQAWKDYQTWRKGYLKYLYDGGMLKPQEYTAIEAAHENHMPLHRLLAEYQADEKAAGGVNKKVLKRITGKGGKNAAEIKNPLVEAAKDSMAVAEEVAKNDAMRALVRFMKEPNAEGFGAAFKIVHEGAEIPNELLSPSTLGNLQKELAAAKEGSADYTRIVGEIAKEANIDPAFVQTMTKDQLEATMRRFKAPRTKVSADGKRIQVVVNNLNGADAKLAPQTLIDMDKRIYDAYSRLPRVAQDPFGRLLKFLGGEFRSGVTDNIFFGSRGLPRDIRHLYRMGGGGMGGLRAIARIPRGIWEAWTGGKQAIAALEDNALMSGMAGAFKTEEKLVSGAARVNSPFQVVGDWYHKWIGRDAATAIENGPRIAEHQEMLAQMKKAGYSEKDARILAGNSAREATTNFLRTGAYPFHRYLQAISPFWNPTLQGWRQEVAAYKANKGTYAARLALGSLAPAAIAWWISHKDPRVKAMSEYDRNANDVLAFPGLPPIKVPRAQGMPSILAAMQDKLFDYMVDKDPGIADEIGHLALGEAINLIPGLSQPAAKVLLLAFGKRLDDMSDVVPKAMQDLPTEDQKFDTTTGAAKGLSWLTGHNVSPIAADEAIRDMTGTMGVEAAKGADFLASLVPGMRNEKEMPSKPFWEQIPGVRGWVEKGDKSFTNNQKKLYDDFADVEKVHNELVRIGKNEPGPKYSAYEKAHADELRKYARMKPGMDRVKALRNRFKAIQQDQKQTPQERRVQLEKMSPEIDQIARKILQEVR